MRGVPARAMPVLDTGRSRTASDVLSMNGAKNITLSSAVVRHLLILITAGGRGKFTNQEILGFYVTHLAEVNRTIPWLNGAVKANKSARLLAAFAYARRTAPKRIDEAADMFFPSAGVNKGTPLYALARYVDGKTYDGEARGGSLVTAYRVLYALKLHLQKRSIAKLVGHADVQSLYDYFSAPWHREASQYS